MGAAMTVALDPVVVVGGWRMAALCRVSVGGRAARRGMAVWAAKVPLAILIDGPGGVMALAVDGTPLPRADIESLAPGVWASFADAP